MEKVDIAQQRGKRRHKKAAGKEKIWRSSVEKVDMAHMVERVDMAQQSGKSSHSAAVWKESTWSSMRGSRNFRQGGSRSVWQKKL